MVAKKKPDPIPDPREPNAAVGDQPPATWDPGKVTQPQEEPAPPAEDGPELRPPPPDEDDQGE